MCVCGDIVVVVGGDINNTGRIGERGIFRGVIFMLD